MTDPILPPVARPHYFTGEALLTDDFICEQAYQMGSRAGLNAALHTYGIAVGLEVQWFKDSQPNQVHVSPGMAIDRLGREIVQQDPQVVVLEGVQGGTTYYLTISYHEVYGGLTDESGVLGYKRVIQQPRITYERTLRDPGLNILLAVLTFTDQSALDTLSYKAGRDERRYVGGRFGAVRLVTEGAGVRSGDIAEGAEAPVHLVARRETDGSGQSFLDVQAARSQVSGQLTTRGNVGIGIDHPTANLQLSTITFKGPGTFTTQGDLLSLSEPVVPGLQPGDLLIPDVSPSVTPPQPSRVAIREALPGGRTYRLAQAFTQDVTRPTRFTYIRTILVRIGDPTAGDLLRIRSDGTLWLGARAPSSPGSATPGPGALTITPDRKVGIGLAGDATPQSALQVAGGIVTDQLVSNGTVKAQSFEGNGSKLTNLSFLSYWTKTNVADNNSPIYYNQGNVGVQITTPPGTLSAGTRPPFIGSGLISTDPADPTKVIGTQTLFTSEIAYGDSITLGKLEPQTRTITAIIDDRTLTVDSQFSVILQKSPYKTNAAGSSSPAQAGQGTISSNGTTIIGTGTGFTALKVGDSLVIDAFEPVPGLAATRMVTAVTNDTALVLQPLEEGQTWDANLSAYMVTSGVMGFFQANQGGPLTAADLPVPALVVRNNGDNGSGTIAPNTVGINLKLEDIESEYALQVSGAVNFAGQSTFSDLTVNTLTVNTSMAVIGDGTANTLMAVGEKGATPLLTVGKTSISMAGTSSVSAPLLSVGGDITAMGTVTAQTVSGTAVTGTTVASTGAMTSGGALTANSLSVQGVAIGADQSVMLFGGRVSYSEANLTNGIFTQTASTDGLVVIFLGTVTNDFKSQFASFLSVQTTLGGSPTSVMSTAASTWPYTYSSGKKSATVLQIPIYGTLTVPVRKGETWLLSKTDAPSDSKIPGASLTFYWVPLGPGTSAQSLRAMGTPPPTPPFMNLLAAIQAQQKHVESGGAVGVPASDVGPAGLTATQAAIDERVNDLTKVLGDATGMDAAPDARADFTRDLQAIVCRADTPMTDAPPLDDGAVQALIDTFGRLTEHQFSGDQRSLLAAGIRALVQINETEQNRENLELIKSNIGFFLDSMETVLQRGFDTGQRRLLTRALVRLVGDGSRTLPGTQADGALGRAAE